MFFTLIAVWCGDIERDYSKSKKQVNECRERLIKCAPFNKKGDWIKAHEEFFKCVSEEKLQ